MEDSYLPRDTEGPDYRSPYACPGYRQATAEDLVAGTQLWLHLSSDKLSSEHEVGCSTITAVGYFDDPEGGRVWGAYLDHGDGSGGWRSGRRLTEEEWVGSACSAAAFVRWEVRR
jgi:hypothetical protein